MLGYDESKKSFQHRIDIVIGIMTFLFLTVICRLFFLQIYESTKYTLMSDKNRVRISPLMPKRGKIFSSDGQVLARSKNRYRLVIENCDSATFLKNLDLLSECFYISDDKKKFLLELRQKMPPYSPIVIKDDLSWNEYAKISLILYKLSHISVEKSFAREYLMPMEFSHVLGYTAKSADPLQILEGKTGIEYTLNDELTGKIGTQQNEINALGKKMRLLDSVAPIDGCDVHLTINAELHKFVYDLLVQKNAGACVVLNAQNGDVLACVSVPGYNPNIWASKITRQQWNEIINDPYKPLLNRATSGVYPPGSIFKIVVAFAALSEGIVSPNDRLYCSGSVKLDDSTFHCWNRYGHGYINMYEAIRMSCDCYFFEIAKKLGIDVIVKYAKKFGFGENSGIEIPNEKSGVLPSKTWKFLNYRSTWKPYETLITSIGQGALLSNLMQLATMIGKLYTENYNFSPTLLKNSQDKEQNVRPVDAKSAKVLKEALYQVCNYEGGTGYRSCHTDYVISGKTGSSQVRRIREGEAGKSQSIFTWKYRDHALFVGCAPGKKPKFIVAILIEHGGGGASVAAPIARKIFDKLEAMNF